MSFALTSLCTCNKSFSIEQQLNCAEKTGLITDVVLAALATVVAILIILTNQGVSLGQISEIGSLGMTAAYSMIVTASAIMLIDIALLVSRISRLKEIYRTNALSAQQKIQQPTQKLEEANASALKSEQLGTDKSGLQTKKKVTFSDNNEVIIFSPSMELEEEEQTDFLASTRVFIYKYKLEIDTENVPSFEDWQALYQEIEEINSYSLSKFLLSLPDLFSKQNRVEIYMTTRHLARRLIQEMLEFLYPSANCFYLQGKPLTQMPITLTSYMLTISKYVLEKENDTAAVNQRINSCMFKFIEDFMLNWWIYNNEQSFIEAITFEFESVQYLLQYLSFDFLQNAIEHRNLFLQTTQKFDDNSNDKGLVFFTNLNRDIQSLVDEINVSKNEKEKEGLIVELEKKCHIMKELLTIYLNTKGLSHPISVGHFFFEAY